MVQKSDIRNWQIEAYREARYADIPEEILAKIKARIAAGTLVIADAKEDKPAKKAKAE